MTDLEKVYTVSDEKMTFFPPQNTCITMHFGGNKTLVLGNKITYTGFDNVDEVTLEFLNALERNFPQWRSRNI